MHEILSLEMEVQGVFLVVAVQMVYKFSLCCFFE